MNIQDILDGTEVNISVEEQKSVLEQMKENKIFDLTETEQTNLTNFLCEKANEELIIEYLFHVLDNEISLGSSLLPIYDKKVKKLFSNEKLKYLMIEKLQDETSEIKKLIKDYFSK